MKLIRCVQLATAALAISAGVLVAGADGSGGGSGATWGSGSAAHKRPRAAFDACAKSKVGDACQFNGWRGGSITGTCQTPREGGTQLVCRRNGNGSGAGSGHAGSGAGSGHGSGAGSGHGSAH